MNFGFGAIIVYLLSDHSHQSDAEFYFEFQLEKVKKYGMSLTVNN